MKERNSNLMIKISNTTKIFGDLLQMKVRNKKKKQLKFIPMVVIIYLRIKIVSLTVLEI